MSLTITLGNPNVIAALPAESVDVHPFRFADGALCVWNPVGPTPPGDGSSKWSSNDGATWSPTPPGGRTNPGPISSGHSEQAAIYCNGSGVIISLRGGCSGGPPGPYTTTFRKSTNDWITVTNESGLLYAPDAQPLIGDEGDSNAGYILHHGLAFSLDGRLIGTFFGSNLGDATPYDGYPNFPNPPPSGPLIAAIKARQLMLFSEFPYGAAWNNAVTVGYDQCFARGTQPDPQPWDIAIAVPITQEGFNETDIRRLADGTYFAVSRTGGRKSIAAAPVPWTSFYGARSADGVTWKLPRALVTDTANGIFSSSPHLATLGNGVLCLIYTTPDAYIIFSEDKGVTWTNKTLLSTSDNDADFVQIGWNTVLAIYYDPSIGAQGSFVSRQVVASIVGNETNPSVQLIATPPVVKSGQSALLQWFTNGGTVIGLELHGGPYSGTSIGPNSANTTGALTAQTDFVITGNGGAYSTGITVGVVA